MSRLRDLWHAKPAILGADGQPLLCPRCGTVLKACPLICGNYGCATSAGGCSTSWKPAEIGDPDAQPYRYLTVHFQEG